jgi:RNA polymerase sigma-70 factor (ECF subfamily)
MFVKAARGDGQRDRSARLFLSRPENLPFASANQNRARRVYCYNLTRRETELKSSEHELIKQAQRGDVDAFCELAKIYQRHIYSLALHYCRDACDAEDLSQEVWLKAFRSIAMFRRESSFYTWLRQITVNSFLNHRRETILTVGHAQVKIKMEELDTLDMSTSLHAPRRSDVEDSLHRKMLVEQVMDALGELTPQQRIIFLLKHCEGMTYDEISQACDCSIGSIKKSLFRAIVKLRQHLRVETEALAPFAAGEKS